VTLTSQFSLYFTKLPGKAIAQLVSWVVWCNKAELLCDVSKLRRVQVNNGLFSGISALF